MKVIIESINDDYKYLQFNERLRLIHLIKEDMFNMKSIIDSCHSNKESRKWLDNQSTKEILDEIIGTGDFSGTQNLYQKRENVSNELKGYYVHRLLVNHIAMWASPRYSIYIMKLLDSYFEHQHIQLQNQIIKQQNQIQKLLPRLIPEKHKNDYVFFIWKEAIPELDSHVILHLVRCHKESFSKVKHHYYIPEEKWFYKDGLPISITCCRDIKNLIIENFDYRDVSVENCSIYVKIELLDTLHQLIETYFNEFQD